MGFDWTSWCQCSSWIHAVQSDRHLWRRTRKSCWRMLSSMAPWSKPFSTTNIWWVSPWWSCDMDTQFWCHCSTGLYCSGSEFATGWYSDLSFQCRFGTSSWRPSQCSGCDTYSMSSQKKFSTDSHLCSINMCSSCNTMVLWCAFSCCSASTVDVSNSTSKSGCSMSKAPPPNCDMELDSVQAFSLESSSTIASHMATRRSSWSFCCMAFEEDPRWGVSASTMAPFDWSCSCASFLAISTLLFCSDLCCQARWQSFLCCVGGRARWPCCGWRALRPVAQDQASAPQRCCPTQGQHSLCRPTSWWPHSSLFAARSWPGDWVCRLTLSMCPSSTWGPNWFATSNQAHRPPDKSRNWANLQTRQTSQSTRSWWGPGWAFTRTHDTSFRCLLPDALQDMDHICRTFAIQRRIYLLNSEKTRIAYRSRHAGHHVIRRARQAPSRSSPKTTPPLGCAKSPWYSVWRFPRATDDFCIFVITKLCEGCWSKTSFPCHCLCGREECVSLLAASTCICHYRTLSTEVTTSAHWRRIGCWPAHCRYRSSCQCIWSSSANCCAPDCGRPLQHMVHLPWFHQMLWDQQRLQARVSNSRFGLQRDDEFPLEGTSNGIASTSIASTSQLFLGVSHHRLWLGLMT